MIRHRWYVGKHDRDGHDVPAETFYQVEQMLVRRFESFTRFNGAGFWRTSKEPTWVYEVLEELPSELEASGRDQGREVAKIIRDMANQEKVLYTIDRTEGELI
jgi:hypothetical protein